MADVYRKAILQRKRILLPANGQMEKRGILSILQSTYDKKEGFCRGMTSLYTFF